MFLAQVEGDRFPVRWFQPWATDETGFDPGCDTQIPYNWNESSQKNAIPA